MTTKILLDSHAFVWFVLGHEKCSRRARHAIEEPGAETYFSAVTAWEIATKVRAGRWQEAGAFISELGDILQAHHFISLPITVEHGRVAGLLPGPHKDPFDRMLAAQAIVEDMTLLTADAAFRGFGARVIW